MPGQQAVHLMMSSIVPLAAADLALAAAAAAAVLYRMLLPKVTESLQEAYQSAVHR
jgi:hypothetical protein